MGTSQISFAELRWELLSVSFLSLHISRQKSHLPCSSTSPPEPHRLELPMKQCVYHSQSIFPICFQMSEKGLHSESRERPLVRKKSGGGGCARTEKQKVDHPLPTWRKDSHRTRLLGVTRIWGFLSQFDTCLGFVPYSSVLQHQPNGWDTVDAQ